MGLFKRGYNAVSQEQKRQEEARKERGKKLFNFFLKDNNEEADIRFLTEEPITFYAHSVKRNSGGKEVYQTEICTGANCPNCANDNRPSFKGAFLILDRREYEYTDSNGKKQTGRNQVRLYIQGAQIISQLDRIHQKYGSPKGNSNGLTCRDITVVRLGTGKNTSYTFERGDVEEISVKEIKEALPESLRDEYDGTQESLYAILEEQLEMLKPKDLYGASDEENDEDDEELEEDDETVEVGEEEEDKPTKKKKLKFGKKHSENSLKKSLKRAHIRRK